MIRALQLLFGFAAILGGGALLWFRPGAENGLFDIADKEGLWMAVAGLVVALFGLMLILMGLSSRAKVSKINRYTSGNAPSFPEPGLTPSRADDEILGKPRVATENDGLAIGAAAAAAAAAGAAHALSSREQSNTTDTPPENETAFSVPPASEARPDFGSVLNEIETSEEAASAEAPQDVSSDPMSEIAQHMEEGLTERDIEAIAEGAELSTGPEALENAQEIVSDDTVEAAENDQQTDATSADDVEDAEPIADAAADAPQDYDEQISFSTPEDTVTETTEPVIEAKTAETEAAEESDISAGYSTPELGSDSSPENQTSEDFSATQIAEVQIEPEAPLETASDETTIDTDPVEAVSIETIETVEDTIETSIDDNITNEVVAPEVEEIATAFEATVNEAPILDEQITEPVESVVLTSPQTEEASAAEHVAAPVLEEETESAPAELESYEDHLAVYAEGPALEETPGGESEDDATPEAVSEGETSGAFDAATFVAPEFADHTPAEFTSSEAQDGEPPFVTQIHDISETGETSENAESANESPGFAPLTIDEAPITEASDEEEDIVAQEDPSTPEPIEPVDQSDAIEASADEEPVAAPEFAPEAEPEQETELDTPQPADDDPSETIEVTEPDTAVEAETTTEGSIEEVVAAPAFEAPEFEPETEASDAPPEPLEEDDNPETDLASAAALVAGAAGLAAASLANEDEGSAEHQTTEEPLEAVSEETEINPIDDALARVTESLETVAPESTEAESKDDLVETTPLEAAAEVEALDAAPPEVDASIAGDAPLVTESDTSPQPADFSTGQQMPQVVDTRAATHLDLLITDFPIFAPIRDALVDTDLDLADRHLARIRRELIAQGDENSKELAALTALAGDHAFAAGRLGGAKWLWRLSLQRFQEAEAADSQWARDVETRLSKAES